MKILGMDSSGLVASVAIVEDGTLIAEYTVNHKKTHSQTLLPMLDEIVRMTETELGSIDAIAIAAGPGSFTGLRIGSATAKGLGFALKKPLISVPTVDALAYNLFGSDCLICPMMDARRNQVYTGLYTFTDGEMITICPQCAVGVDEIIRIVNERGEKVIFLGDGVPVYLNMIKEMTQVPYLIAPASCNKQRASLVADLGLRMLEQGKTVGADEFAPDYLRLSQAERERMEKEQG